MRYSQIIAEHKQFSICCLEQLHCLEVAWTCRLEKQVICMIWKFQIQWKIKRERRVQSSPQWSWTACFAAFTSLYLLIRSSPTIVDEFFSTFSAAIFSCSSSHVTLSLKVRDKALWSYRHPNNTHREYNYVKIIQNWKNNRSKNNTLWYPNDSLFSAFYNHIK